MAFIPHVHTTKNVTVYIEGEQHIVPSGTPQYDLVIAAIAAGDIQGVKDAVNVRQAVVNMSQGKIVLDGSTLTYDGQPLHGALVSRILTVVKEAGNAAPLLTFLDNLMQNPSHRAVTELYGFMEACDLPITADGHFLAYKKVRRDYKSIHDGKTDNSIGSKPSMPRNMVNDNKDQTCSTGLHFCSKSYLSEFGSYDGSDRVVVVKINPRDVVSIPSDYNNAKGRACTYEIIGELTATSDGGFEELAVHYDTKFVRPPIAPAPLVDNDWEEDELDWDEDEEEDELDKVAKFVNVQKFTATKQTAVGQTTLDDTTVRAIRQALDENWPLATIAKTYGTSARTVARIRDGETYTHVK